MNQCILLTLIVLQVWDSQGTGIIIAVAFREQLFAKTSLFTALRTTLICAVHMSGFLASVTYKLQ